MPCLCHQSISHTGCPFPGMTPWAPRVSYWIRGLPTGAPGHLGWLHTPAILPGAAEPDRLMPGMTRAPHGARSLGLSAPASQQRPGCVGPPQVSIWPISLCGCCSSTVQFPSRSVNWNLLMEAFTKGRRGWAAVTLPWPWVSTHRHWASG